MICPPVCGSKLFKPTNISKRGEASRSRCLHWLDPRANPRNSKTKGVVTEFGIIMTGNWPGQEVGKPLTGSVVIQMMRMLLESHQCKAWHTK